LLQTLFSSSYFRGFEKGICKQNPQRLIGLYATKDKGAKKAAKFGRCALFFVCVGIYRSKAAIGLLEGLKSSTFFYTS
jgi:hypothetical protein